MYEVCTVELKEDPTNILLYPQQANIIDFWNSESAQILTFYEANK